MTKAQMDAIPDAAWNALLDGRTMDAINALREAMPFLGLVGAKRIYDDMRREFGLPVYDSTGVLT